MNGDGDDGGAPDATPRKGDQYRHDDGTVEVVFTTAEGRVLCVREYPDETTFSGAVADADYEGTNPEVADLPGVEAFREDEAPDGDDSE